VRHAISLRNASRAFSNSIRQVAGGADLHSAKLISEAGKKVHSELRISKLLCKIR
jgi:hypothetical protein